MDNDSNIRDILTRLVSERGVTAADLSRGSGLSYSIISDILRGRIKKPRYDTVKKLADYFGVTPAQLLGQDPLTAVKRTTAADDIANRVAAIEKKLEAGEMPPPLLDDETRKRLRDKYIRQGLVALRTERLDAAGLDALYSLLWKVDLAETERERDGGSLPADNGQSPGG